MNFLEYSGGEGIRQLRCIPEPRPRMIGSLSTSTTMGPFDVKGEPCELRTEVLQRVDETLESGLHLVRETMRNRAKRQVTMRAQYRWHVRRIPEEHV